MKIVLTESQIQNLKLNEELLNELKETQHIIDRFNQRLTRGGLRVTLRYEEKIPDSHRTRTRDRNVGLYRFSDYEKNIIKEKINLIFKYDYKITGKIASYAVLIHKFNIIGNLQNINIWDKDKNDEIENDVLLRTHLSNGTGKLYFTGFNLSGESSGEKGMYYADALALIIRNNTATTAFYGKFDSFSESYLGVDRYIKNVAELKNFATGESTIPDKIKKFLNPDLEIDGDKNPPESDSPTSDLPSIEEPTTDLPSTEVQPTDITPTEEPPVRIKRPRIKIPIDNRIP
jgi:hypothetical protein